jgi:hypothetical protein
LNTPYKKIPLEFFRLPIRSRFKDAIDHQRQKTEAELRKEEEDKNKERRGAIQRKRLHVLRNLDKLAFRADVSEPWTFVDYCEYIEWCHIGKVFLKDRHNKH